MPQLEDTRKLAPKTVPTGTDLVAILDVSEAGSSPVKKSTLSQVLQAAINSLPGPYANNAAALGTGLIAGGEPYLLTSGGEVLIAILVE